MQLIDTHAHLDSIDDIDGALQRAVDAGVCAVVAVGENREANRKNLALLERIEYPKIILALGIHPGRIDENALEDEFRFIEEHVGQASAIGEIGLDHWYQWVRNDSHKKAVQRDVYRRLLALAERHQLPVVIHTRGAWREAFEIAKEMAIHKAVFHWYSGPVDVLEDILSQGYLISASPSAAYSPESRRALEIAPVEQTMIETDSPVFYRHCDGGFQAEPKDVFRTLRYYADIKQCDQEQLAITLNNNAQIFFNIKE